MIRVVVKTRSATEIDILVSPEENPTGKYGNSTKFQNLDPAAKDGSQKCEDKNTSRATPTAFPAHSDMNKIIGVSRKFDCNSSVTVFEAIRQAWAAEMHHLHFKK